MVVMEELVTVGTTMGAVMRAALFTPTPEVSLYPYGLRRVLARRPRRDGPFWLVCN
jgi:hypothetical protein